MSDNEIEGDLEDSGAPLLDREVFLALNECDDVMREGQKTHDKDSWRNGDLNTMIKENLSNAVGQLLLANKHVEWDMLQALSECDDIMNECDDIMREGQKTHDKDSWRNGDLNPMIKENLSHATGHLLLANECVKWDIEGVDLREELSHAATRCLMALQLYLEKIEEGES